MHLTEVFFVMSLVVAKREEGHSPNLPTLAEGTSDYKPPVFKALFLQLFCSRLVDRRRRRGVSLPDT